MKTTKKNRLRSFLLFSLSLTIVVVAFASARYLYDVPTPPRLPRISNITSDGCDLRFDPPVDDGGKSIIRYLVERKYGSLDGKYWEDWEPAARTNNLHSTIDGLKKGVRIKFRIIAINIIGASEPSEETISFSLY